MNGLVSYVAGLAAEESVVRHYQLQGHEVIAQRWRGARREIDLILRDGETVVFVEVKKSQDFARAAQRVSRRQIERIQIAASLFLETEPLGQLSPCRFDVALVNNRSEVEILKNVLAY